ncbi:MAG: hypothetical protein IJU54_00640 [Alphaproteobacteria bacterium]|nr:hypothetical protein [Alphaproteobacteria bacterium]
MFINNKNILFVIAIFLLGSNIKANQVFKSNYDTEDFSNIIEQSIEHVNVPNVLKNPNNFITYTNYSTKCRGKTNPYNNTAFLETVVIKQKNKNIVLPISDSWVVNDENFYIKIKQNNQCRGLTTPYDNCLYREVIVQKKGNLDSKIKNSLQALFSSIKTANTVYLDE